MRSTRMMRVTAVAAPLALAAMALTPVGVAGASAAPAAATPAAGLTPLTPAMAHQLSEDVTQRVIVVLKASVTSKGRSDAAEEATAASAQRPVVDDLKATGSKDVKGLSIVDDVVATVSAGEEARLRSDAAVAEVVPDELVRMASPTRASLSAAGFPAADGSCTTGKTVQLDPEAIEAIHAASQSGKGDTAQALGYTGHGVKVGFIADGIDTSNPDFIRADGQHVFTGYQDFSNSGTDSVTSGGEAFLDASSIAAQGRHTYNLENYGTGLNQTCDIRILGVAPGATLDDLDTFGDSDDNFTSALLEAVDYGTTHGLNVINESFGDNPFPDVESLDLVEQADDAAVAKGVVITASSGDAGPTDTIGSPASDPNIISAGATTTFRGYLQSGIGGAVGAPVKVTGWDSNNISALSSGGATENGDTVDVVAPGDLNWALCSPDPAIYQACTNFEGKPASVELTGGTSEAAPLTAGTAALVIQAYRLTHYGRTPTPAVVKQIITSTAQDVHAPGDEQGAGMIDAYAAVLAARSYDGTRKAAGHAVLTSANQLDSVAPEGTTDKLPETLTNDGAGSETLKLSGRALGAYTSVKTGSVALSSAKEYESVVHFTVPAGAGRLDAQIAWDGGAANLALYNPEGDYAAYSLPQGDGGHGAADVADPRTGTWTALIFGSSAETVHFLAETAAWTSFGTVTPSSVTLAAGASTSVSLQVTGPAVPGDEDGSLVVQTTGTGAPSFTTSSTVPVIIRTLVPTPDDTTSFTGTLTGGNGRSTDLGQSAFYEVDVPSGTPDLSASITVPDKSDTFDAELVAPDGVAESTAGNSLLAQTDSGAALTEEKGTQLHVLSPAAGTWTLVLNFFDTVSGTAVTQPYDVTMSAAAADASAGDLPDSTSDHIAVGDKTTVDVEVTNTGDSPEAYFVDGRLDKATTLKLAPITTASDKLPNLGTTTPTYLVPSESTSVGASVTSPSPALFDLSYIFGDPDVIADPATRTDDPSLDFAATPSVPAGVYAVDAFLDGPDGAAGDKATTVKTAMTATTDAFDPGLTSPTGDLWAAATSTDATVTPYVVDPGQTAEIPVTIDPTAADGTEVSGTLYVDDDSSIPSEAGNSLSPAGGVLPSGSEIAAFPYEYSVGAPPPPP